MDRMSLVLLLRVGLHAIALMLGSFGIFAFYWSCLGVPVAAYAIVSIGTATAIVLVSGSDSRLSH